MDMGLAKKWSLATIEGLQNDPFQYYLGGKNLSACLHAYLRLESTNHQKIGEIIKALQICKRLTQTASL